MQNNMRYFQIIQKTDYDEKNEQLTSIPQFKLVTIINARNRREAFNKYLKSLKKTTYIEYQINKSKLEAKRIHYPVKNSNELIFVKKLK